MKEQSFLDKYTEDKVIDKPTFTIPIYYTLDDEGNIIIDEESIEEEFEHKLNEIIEEVLK